MLQFLLESDRESRMSRLAELLSNLSEFRIHTGNINQWAALKARRFENSSEELTECLRMQLESWVPSEAQLKESEGGSVTLIENSHCNPCSLDEIGDRKDLAVTLKIFLSGLCPIQARRCLHAVLAELRTERVEKLIVALTLEVEEGETEEAEAEAWVNSFWPLWLNLCELIKEGKVVELGVADLELPQLKALTNRAEKEGVPAPAINHYNIQSCCSVPDDLQVYAKGKGIKLLTHNDPKPFCTDNSLEEICCNFLNMPVCPLPGAVKWTARYAVMIISRSIMTAKGFVVDYGTCDKSHGRP